MKCKHTYCGVTDGVKISEFYTPCFLLFVNGILHFGQDSEVPALICGFYIMGKQCALK